MNLQEHIDMLSDSKLCCNEGCVAVSTSYCGKDPGYHDQHLFECKCGWAGHFDLSEYEDTCNCGNCDYGFNCSAAWWRENKGDVWFTCEYCGMYEASRPMCNKCDRE